VRVTSADRVLFPDAGVTKGDLADYYAAIAPAVLPHLRDRPFTMKRYRDGIEGGGFFQKQAPKGMQDWIPTRRFRTFPREGGSRLVDFALVNDELTLVWMVQIERRWATTRPASLPSAWRACSRRATRGS
jgi:bifunctional non-homologous end joining protein LigD